MSRLSKVTFDIGVIDVDTNAMAPEMMLRRLAAIRTSIRDEPRSVSDLRSMSLHEGCRSRRPVRIGDRQRDSLDCESICQVSGGRALIGGKTAQREPLRKGPVPVFVARDGDIGSLLFSRLCVVEIPNVSEIDVRTRRECGLAKDFAVLGEMSLDDGTLAHRSCGPRVAPGGVDNADNDEAKQRNSDNCLDESRTRVTAACEMRVHDSRIGWTHSAREQDALKMESSERPLAKVCSARHRELRREVVAPRSVGR